MKADIRIFENEKALSHAAASLFIEAAHAALQTRAAFLVALSGGGTPFGLYRLLSADPYRGQVDWPRTFVFWGDERCVPPDDPGSNYKQAHETLLRHVPIPGGNVHRIQGEQEPAQASDAYAQTLKRFAAPGLDWPRFDLVLLGLGEDGHTASLFPGSQVEAASPVLAVTADYQGRPAQRVTLTPLVFNSARQIVFLVSGASKASALEAVFRGAYQPQLLPAQRIHPTDGQIIWLVDEAVRRNLGKNSLVE